MLASGIIALPLNTEAPAGLIVLFTAGLMHKPVVSTNNITMREYITSGESGYLAGMGDHKALALRIRELHSDQELRKRIGENLFSKVAESGSPEVYIDKLISIVKGIDSDYKAI
jgi:glycosyltransferase involved in cell wall biosynthesis